MLNGTMPPWVPVGPVSHRKDSLALVRKILNSDEKRSLCWKMSISASAPDMSRWGCPKACELKLFSNSKKGSGFGSSTKVSFFLGGGKN